LNDEIVKDKIVLFVHDDVSIEDSMLKEKLNEAIKTFDIIGLAGSKNVDLKKPAAWHLMANNVDWSGAVAHIKDGQTFMTSFGSMPKEVDLIDGLFMAINVEKVKDVLFDEQFQFHHYDLDMCMTAKKQGLKIGTYPIWVTHLGLGDSMYSNEWKENAKKFSTKWRR
jgi:GT2 family glycosyltransferase